MKATGLDQDVVDLQSGLNTLITADGRGVSSGQAQRILLSAALLRNTEILCLDEPTSHCHSNVSKQIGEALLMYPGTVIVCTHDPSLMALPFRKIYIDSLAEGV
jgi:ATP-binding cassette subfamily C protein CydD